MEIKTCEEYVLRRVSELEDELSEVKDSHQILLLENAKLQKAYDELRSNLRYITQLQVTSSGEVYVDFNNPWEDYENELFTYFKNVLDLGESKRRK